MGNNAAGQMSWEQSLWGLQMSQGLWELPVSRSEEPGDANRVSTLPGVWKICPEYEPNKFLKCQNLLKLETCGFTQSCLQPDTQVWYFSQVHRVWLEIGISVVLLRNDLRFPDLLPVELRYHSLKGQANHINCNEQNKCCHVRSQYATCNCFVTTYHYTCTIIQKL